MAKRSAPTSPKPNTKITSDALAGLIDKPVQRMLFHDKRSGQALCCADGELFWFDGFAIAPPPFAIRTDPHTSFHYDDERFCQLKDLSEFFAGARMIEDRVLLWSFAKGQYEHIYLDAFHVDARVFLQWGRNNARNLCHAGLVFGDTAQAAAFVATLRSSPPKGLKPMSTPFVADNKGVMVREYHPTPAEKAERNARLWTCYVIDNIETRRLVGDNAEGAVTLVDVHETHSTVDAAYAAHQRFELTHYQNGGRPYEVEWKKRW